MFMVANCLDQILSNDINEDIKAIMGKYLSKIPDMEPRYVLNEKLSSVINHYFKGKISTLPLYRISLKIDRNPVKIPWTLSSVDETHNDVVLQRAQMLEEPETPKQVREYKVVKVANLRSTKNPDTSANASKKATSTTTEPPLIEIQ